MSTEVNKDRMSWIKAVAALFEISKQGLAKKFQADLKKTWEKNLKTRKKELVQMNDQKADELEDMNTQLEELMEQRDNKFIAVDVDRIGSLEERKAYIIDFNRAIDRAMDAVVAQEEAIEEYLSNMDTRIKDKQREIDHFTNKLEMIK